MNNIFGNVRFGEHGYDVYEINPPSVVINLVGITPSLTSIVNPNPVVIGFDSTIGNLLYTINPPALATIPIDIPIPTVRYTVNPGPTNIDFSIGTPNLTGFVTYISAPTQTINLTINDNLSNVTITPPAVGMTFTVPSGQLFHAMDYEVQWEQGGPGFVLNDLLYARMQDYDKDGNIVGMYDVKARVTSNSVEGFNDLELIEGATSWQALEKNRDGIEFVRIGNTTNTSRQGSVIITADGIAPDAVDLPPYIDVKDGVDSFDGFFYGLPKVRLGKLDGITDPDFGALEGYGLYGQNVYLKGTMRISNPEDIPLSGISGTLDDIVDGAVYGKVATTAISGGLILLTETIGDLDDIDDGTSYGKILKTGISAGRILLTETVGDLDDVGDGANYGRILKTDISAGHILLSATVEDATYKKYTNTEKTKLSGIATGATVGADWSTNLSNIPSTLQTPSSAGLFLGTSNMGYYNGTTWKTYMDNSGNFYLSGATGGLTWNAAGDALTIKNGSFSTSVFGSSVGVHIETGGIGVVGGSGDVATVISPNSILLDAGAAYTSGAITMAGASMFISSALIVNSNLTVNGSYGLDATDIPNLAASKITSGTFADARIASAATWNALVTFPGFGTSHLTAAYGDHSHTFASLTSKPTTLSGYGITDGVTTSDILPIAQGGTGRSSHTGGRVIVSNVGGTELGVSTVTSTQLNALGSGVTVVKVVDGEDWHFTNGVLTLID